MGTLVLQIQYESGDEVDDDNVESYVAQLLNKFMQNIMRIMHRGRYRCPFDTSEPRDGDLQSLRQHANELSISGSTLLIKANHRALKQYLDGQFEAGPAN